jgi:hypothetical protein
VADNSVVQRTSRPTIDYGVVFAGLVISVFAGILGLTGLAVGAIGLLKAWRQKMSYSDVPATELARRRLSQAVSAAAASASAGANAWRQASPTKG